MSPNNLADFQAREVIVIGAGVAGSAVALELCRLGHKVTLLWRAEEEGSSFTNQKWHHSGLLYPSEFVARMACRELLRESLLSEFVYETSVGARFLALNSRTLDEREQMWQDWGVRTWGLNWRRLEPDEYRTIGLLGGTSAIGGFEVPDRVVDFPRLIRYLRDEVRVRGGRVIRDAHASRIRFEADGVKSVEFILDRDRYSLDCSRCVLAAGAWSNTLLDASGIGAPNLILRKCVVFEYDDELVSGLTTCLDISGYDKTTRDVTLVPFYGKTLAAGTGFSEVSASDNSEPDLVQVDRLDHELVQCFATLANRKRRIVTCTKTERRTVGKADVQPQVYGREFHGITGLAVAIPGKASFMFDLVTKVLSELDLETS